MAGRLLLSAIGAKYLKHIQNNPQLTIEEHRRALLDISMLESETYQNNMAAHAPAGPTTATPAATTDDGSHSSDTGIVATFHESSEWLVKSRPILTCY